MALLSSLMNDTVDPAYADAARRRAATDGSGWPRRAWVSAVTLLVIGLLLASAAVQVRTRADATAAIRDRLIGEIDERNASLDRQQRDLERLRSSIASDRESALSLTAAGDALAARLGALEFATGATAVTGPGLRVVLDDADGSTEGAGHPRDAGEPDDGRVIDYDLQRLVNALWQSGAEAISVNERRLTALTAIRLAGEAIVIDYRPVAPPYVVTAVGDPAQLEARFAETAGGRYVRGLTANYGLQMDVSTRKRLHVPAASSLQVQRARVLQERAS